MNTDNRTRNWWLVYCVILLYSDLSAAALQGKVLAASMRKHTTSEDQARVVQDTRRTKRQSQYGTCDTLVLTGGSTIPQSSRRHGFDIFRRKNSGLGLDAWYQASHDPNVQLFYQETLQKWVIGVRDKGRVKIALQFECLTANPQDSHCGAHTSQNKDGSLQWIFDPTLHLQCREGYKVGRSKRFLFAWIVAFVFVTLVVPAIPKIIEHVQKNEGCLFYPSVCEMRDRIKKELSPKIEELQSYLDSFGDSSNKYTELPGVFRQTMSHMDTMQSMARNLDIMNENLKNKLQMKTVNSSYNLILEKFRGVHVLQRGALEHYTHWLQSHDSSGLDNALLIVEMNTAVFSAVTKSSLILEFALQLVVSIIEISFTVVEERNIKMQLEKQIKDMVDVIEILEKQKKALDEFKEIYISQVIPDIKRFVRYIKKDNIRFWKTLTHFSRKDIKMRSLVLVNDYLHKISTKIEADEVNMMKLISNFEKQEKFEFFLLSLVKNKVNFETIYDLSIQKCQELDLPQFGSKFGLLQFIAKYIVNSSCYWGINLDEIRKEETQMKDWSTRPLCLSEEMGESFSLLESGISKNLAPCRLLRQLNEKKFDNTFKVVRFIADHLLRNETCYWGYDLPSIRKFSTEREKFPVIDTHTILFLHYVFNKSADQTETAAFELLCQEKNVCIESTIFQKNLMEFSCTGKCGKFLKNEHLASTCSYEGGDNFC